MISLVWAIFRGSRTLQAMSAILVGWIGWNINNTYQRHQGATKVIEKSKEAGRVANAKNEAVRRAAREPGAFERLRKSDCPNCN